MTTSIPIAQIDPGDLEWTRHEGVRHLIHWAALDGHWSEGALCGVNPSVFDGKDNGGVCRGCILRRALARKREKRGTT